MKTSIIILISIIIGILLSPIFIIYYLAKTIKWKILKDIYKEWFKS